MTNEAAGATERSIEERLRVLEQVVTMLSERKADIDRLADATVTLNESTTGVENVLRDVSTAMSASSEAKATANEANSKADDSLAQLATSEHRYRRHTRRMAAVAVIISLIASGGVLYLQRHATHEFNAFLTNVAHRCEVRRAYDQANHLSVGADITELKSELRQARDSRAATEHLIRSFPPAQQVALHAEVLAAHRALRTDLAVKQRAYAQGVIGSCGSLH